MTIRSATVFRAILLSFVLGICAGSFFYVASDWLPLLSIALGVVIFGAWLGRFGVLVFFAALVFSIGFFHAGISIRNAMAVRETGEVSGVAEIVRKPEQKSFSQDAVVRFSECHGPCAGELLLVRFPLLTEISIGDRGALSCQTSVPEEEWKMYYAKEGIALLCSKPKWEKSGEAGAFFGGATRWMDAFERSLERSLPEPESSLAAGMLLGGEGRLPDETKEAFRAAGLSHIVAVSGYNISIIAGYLLMLGVLCFLSRNAAAFAALLGIGVFVFLVGAPPSAVRAAGMASILVVSWWFGRRYGSIFAALLFGAAMLLANPLLLRYDIGFLLSFSATIGIILFSPIVGRFSSGKPLFARVFFEGFLLTVAAEIFIIPIILSNFGSLPILAIPTNTILLPLVPLSMFFSFFAGLSGLVSEVLGQVFGFPAFVLLHAIVSGAHLAASFEKTVIAVEAFPLWFSFGWYLVVFASRYALSRRGRRKTDGSLIGNVRI